MPESSWFFCRKPLAEPGVRLFCCPAAGGSTAMYFGWPDLVPEHVEVHIAQLPGRERRGREPLLTRLDDLLDGLVPAMEPLLDRPFAIFGHSLGAVVGFEVARTLRRQHSIDPIQLFVAARPAPHERTTPMPRLPDDEFVTFLEANYGPLPDVVRNDADLLRHFLPIIRADMDVLGTYRFREDEPLNCPITVYGGASDPTTSAEQLQAWAVHTSREFTLNIWPGDHFFPQSQRSMLLADLSRRLHAAS